MSNHNSLKLIIHVKGKVFYCPLMLIKLHHWNGSNFRVLLKYTYVSHLDYTSIQVNPLTIALANVFLTDRKLHHIQNPLQEVLYNILRTAPCTKKDKDRRIINNIRLLIQRGRDRMKDNYLHKSKFLRVCLHLMDQTLQSM